MTSAKLVIQAEQRAATRSAVYLQNPRHYLYSKYKLYDYWRHDWLDEELYGRFVEVRVLGQWDLRVTAKPVTKAHVPR